MDRECFISPHSQSLLMWQISEQIHRLSPSCYCIMPVSILSTLDLPAASEAPLLGAWHWPQRGIAGGVIIVTDTGTQRPQGTMNSIYCLYRLCFEPWFYILQFHFIMLINPMTFLKSAEYLFSLYNKPIIIICCHCPTHLCCSPTPKSLSINSPGVSPHP